MVKFATLVMLPVNTGVLQVHVSKDITKEEFEAIISVLREKFFGEMIHNDAPCGMTVLEPTDIDKFKPDSLTMAIREFKELVGLRDSAQVFWKEYQNPIVIRLMKEVRDTPSTKVIPKLRDAGIEWLYYMIENVTVK